MLRSRLTDCTDNRPETVLSLCRLLKSCVRSKFSIFIAYLSSLLFFLSKLPPSIKNELVTKTDQFCTAQRQVQNCASERDRVCVVIAGQSSRGKEIREQEYYYETIAMLILIGKKLGQSPSRKY